MFRDRQQAARVCRILLSHCGLAELWDDDGPRDPEHLSCGGDARSSGMRCSMLLLCSDLWHKTGSVDGGTAAFMLALDRRHLHMVSELFAALRSDSEGAVDRWIDSYAEVPAERHASP